ncbi:MAG: hypothetical protein AAF797_06415 [Planctomycetota bacterium]
MATLIRRRLPDATIMFAGMAHVSPKYLEQVRTARIAPETAYIGLHPYTGEAPAWDLSHGQLQGLL